MKTKEIAEMKEGILILVGALAMWLGGIAMVTSTATYQLGMQVKDAIKQCEQSIT